jgi:hypothetical protein
VPRLLIKTSRGIDEPNRSTAWFWVESHGADFSFALPNDARWVGARVDGRIADQVDYEAARSRYRLRLPIDSAAKPVLVELEYQGQGQDTTASWEAPRLLDGGVVLQSLWELHLPWSVAVVGVPRGWSDENEWHWAGLGWRRRAWKNQASLNDWLRGAGASSRAIGDLSAAGIDDSDRYLFSRSGEPCTFYPWLVPRSLLVAVCSGATLFVGFFVIFTKMRFRTIWLGTACLGLLSAILVQPAVTFLAIQSAFFGAALTLLGLSIERLIERWRLPPSPARQASVTSSKLPGDSSLNRSAGVGSDDSTAIRVRVPSTADFLAAPSAAAPVEDAVRSSTLDRT